MTLHYQRSISREDTLVFTQESVIAKIKPVFPFLQFWSGEGRNGTGGRCELKSSIQVTHWCKLGNLTLLSSRVILSQDK